MTRDRPAEGRLGQAPLDLPITIMAVLVERIVILEVAFIDAQPSTASIFLRRADAIAVLVSYDRREVMGGFIDNIRER